MTRAPFEKILVANRGEIAVRVLRACRALGIRTVAAYSEADRRALHVSLADEAVSVGGPKASESYLVASALIRAAREHGCDAVHPGYGFLAENPDFSRDVAAAGLAFIGPPADAMALLADKVASKKLATELGLPVASATVEKLATLEEVRAAAAAVGFPVLLKPVAGGGGKGMRIAESDADLGDKLLECQAEARKAFGDDAVFVERYLARARHVEIQILADHHGSVIHLGERECSIQRRYQKIIEEAPALGVHPELRETLGGMACALARAAGYRNAGTVEFLLTEDGSLYFMEVNTRLQVEHPVTELVTGLDLVELQIRIAAGEPLPLRQEDVKIEGWAIEARVCAEDPSRNFLPSTGIVTRYEPPRGKNVRVDSGIEAGSLVSFYYDSLLAKIVASGPGRNEARETLVDALNGTLIEGVETNLNFLTSILNHTAYQEGDLSTDFLATHFPEGRSSAPRPAKTLRSMALAATLIFHNRIALVRESLKPMAALVGTAPRTDSWTLYMVRAGKEIFEVLIKGDLLGRNWTFRVNGYDLAVVSPQLEFYQHRLILQLNGRRTYFCLKPRGNFIEISHDGLQETFEVYTPLEWKLAQFMPVPKKREANNVLECPMPGHVVRVFVRTGDWVYKRQALVVIESMKMESVISSPIDAKVSEVLVSEGQNVEMGAVLMRFR